MKSFASEKDLILAIREGDEGAFAQFYNTYLGRVRVLLLFLGSSPETAEDIAQDAFSRLWEQRERLDTENSLKAYVRTIARNLFYDQVRKSAVRDLHTAQQLKNALPVSPDPHHLLSEKEGTLRLEEAIGRLSAEKQEMFRLSRTEGLTYPQIAGLLQTSPKAVERHIARSVLFIRRYIGNHLDVPVKLIAVALFKNFFH